MLQSYELTIRNLYAINEGAMVGGHAVIAILDGGTEIDRVKVSGKIGPGACGYRREYQGRPRLSAELLT